MKRVIILLTFLFSLSIYSTLAYLTGPGTLYIYDVVNPDSVEKISETGIYNGSYYTSSNDVWVVGDYAYLAATTSPSSWWELGGLIVYNVADSSNPYFVSYSTAHGNGKNIYIQGTLAYLVTGDVHWPPPNPPYDDEGGLYIYDISDPLNPLKVDSMTLPGDPTSVFVDSNLVYVGQDSAAGSLYVFTYPPQGVSEEIIKDEIDIRYEGNRIVVEFISSSTGEVEVKIFDPLGRELRRKTRRVAAGFNKITMNISRLRNGIYFIPVTVNGETCRNKFIKLGAMGKVSNASRKTKTKGDLQLISSISVKTRNIYAIPDFVFVTPDRINEVRSIDVSDPYNPEKRGGVSMSGGLGVKDTLLFCNDNILKTVNISDPANPVRIDTLGTENARGGGGDVQIKGNYAYTHGNEFHIYDISNPLGPYEIYHSEYLPANSIYIK